MKLLLKLKKAFTLIELLVVITIIAILAGIALPVFSSVQIKGAQTKALSNAKQIALALRLYASDNNGIYPSYQLSNGVPGSAVVNDSNTAFAQLFPTYVQTEDIFWLTKSAWCSAYPNGPDDQIDNPPLDTPVKTLEAGENEWAYVIGLNDSSNPAVPLIADGFVTGGDKGGHNYTVDQTVKGGVWKGANAVVVRADSSGKVEKVSVQNEYYVFGPNGGDRQGDIFWTANSANGWLGMGNIAVNPK